MPRNYTWTVEWDPERWLEHYHEAQQPPAVAKKLEEKLEAVRQKGACALAEFFRLVARVRKILDKHYMPREMRPFYLSYAEQMYFKVREYEWTVDRLTEWRILRMKWEARGLKPEILDEIDQAIKLGRGR